MDTVSTQEPQHLLDYLARRCGCICLSDLRSPKQRLRLASKLRSLQPADFPLVQWQQAARYLLGLGPSSGDRASLIRDEMVRLLSLQSPETAKK